MFPVDLKALAAIAAIYLLGVMSPGPNFMVVAQRSVAYGRADGLATMAGVVTVSGLWAGASLFGLGVVFALFPWTRLALRIAGAAYLVWMGVKLWRNARAPLAAPDGGTRARGGWRAYRAGLSTNLSNAKAIAFYTSAFSAAAPTGHAATAWLALALVLVIALAWYGLVATALSSGRVAAAYRRAKAPIERACGVLMIGFGAKLAAG